ncbi:hypothetical protein [Magnetococcus sp. PR-3]|uniref:hypothetical protein n=1 Tax=Magnetococcus sp. PR-3 TaxID=3120355 RepID=UPI002FCE47B7
MTLAETMQQWDFTQETMLILSVAQGVMWLMLVISLRWSAQGPAWFRLFLCNPVPPALSLLFLGGIMLYAMVGFPCVHYLYGAMLFIVLGMACMAAVLWIQRHSGRFNASHMLALTLVYGAISLWVHVSIDYRVTYCYEQFPAKSPPLRIMDTLRSRAFEMNSLSRPLTTQTLFPDPWFYVCVEAEAPKKTAEYLLKKTGLKINQRALAVGVDPYHQWITLADRRGQIIEFYQLERDRILFSGFFCGPIHETDWIARLGRKGKVLVESKKRVGQP